MAIKLKPVSSHAIYNIGDESGYKFDIHTHLDDEWGWQANVTVTCYGRVNEQNALNALVPAVTHLLRMLKENKDECQGDSKTTTE